MEVFRHPADVKTAFSQKFWGKKTIGFVPTMGALHEGHVSLVDKSLAENDLTVVSIFVNPTQFGPNEDFSRYPRTPEADFKMLENKGEIAVFMPEPGDMYPTGTDEVKIFIQNLDKVLCGASRPGHFNGVLQVVNKLFNIVRPERSYFGLKDYQQFLLISIMAREFFHFTEVVGCPIIREPDGLAMSSRNRYMNAEERRQALYLSKALNFIRENAREGADAKTLIAEAQKMLVDYPLIRPDYFEIRREDDLSEVTTLRKEEKPRAFIAAWCGTPRLIDNANVF